MLLPSAKLAQQTLLLLPLKRHQKQKLPLKLKQKNLPKTDKKIIVGKILSAHGIKGAVKYLSFTENPDTLFKLKPLYCGDKEITLKKSGPHATIEGIADRTQAETCRSRELWVWRNQLPEPTNNQYYIEDLIGLNVIAADGEELGTVLSFHNFGAGDIMEIKLKDETTEMFGFEQVKKVDIENTTIYLKE